MRKGADLKGRAAIDVDSYMAGTNYVSKYGVTRDLSGKAYCIGHESERLDKGSSRPASDTSASSNSEPSSSKDSASQGRIDKSMLKQ